MFPLIPVANLPQPALIGVSAGRDSVALLHMLRAQGANLTVCHFDHRLRPESSDEAGFVRQLAAQIGVSFELGQGDVATRARERRQSLEAAARDARYEFFAEVAGRLGCARLFLGHHADDQAETFLLQAFRGAGSAGLGGMRPVTMRRFGEVELEIVRPLLGMWREEINEYVAEHSLPFCEDSSNADPAFARNRVRHEILPMIERVFGRDVRAALWRSAEILRAEDEFIAEIPELQQTPNELCTAALRAMPLALQRRMIQKWLTARGVEGVGFREIEEVRSLLDGLVAKVNLPGGFHARRREKRIFIDGR